MSASREHVEGAASPEGEGGGHRRVRVSASFVGLVGLYSVVWLALWVLVPVVALGYSATVVTSESMRPHVRAGDVILLTSLTDEIGPGDVITFSSPAHPDRLITHRVTEVTGTMLTTRGDATPAPDPRRVSVDAVEGVGTFLIPAIGLPVVWMGSGITRLVTTLVGMGLLALAVRYGVARRDIPARTTTACLVLVVAIAGSVPRSAAAFTASHEIPVSFAASTVSAPGDLVAECIRGAGQGRGQGRAGLRVELTWIPSPEGIAQDLHRTADDGTEVVVPLDAVVAEYTDTDVRGNREYTYFVRTHADGGWYADSEAVSAAC